MDDVLCGMCDSISLEPEAEESLAGDILFVLTNDGDIQGAACMFDRKIMEKTAAKLDSNLVITPVFCGRNHHYEGDRRNGYGIHERHGKGGK